MQVTLYAELITKATDLGGYTTYVFKNLNSTQYEDKYIMCVQFPNWNQKTINVGDIGYVNIQYVKAGITQWFDGEQMHTYKYTNIVFLKFIHETTQIDQNYIID
jgi:hypothetical protein